MKIPLAWLQLTHEKIRLLIALAGIGFADMLMFMQLGFQAALFDSSTTLHRSLEGDVFLMNRQSDALISLSSFSRRSLYQALGEPEVAEVSPVYINFGLWKNPETRETRQLMVLGFNPADEIFDLPGIDSASKDAIKLPDVVLFDAQSRLEFGPVAELFTDGETVETEVEQREIRVGGLFEMGASFGADGNLITSDLNFLRLFPNRDPGLIEIGIIQLKPGADAEQVAAKLQQKLPEDVQVYTKEEFVDSEREYWETSTSIGFVFNLGTAIGFVVGIVIVYQILYTDVANHLPEYATLKAMGYRDRYFIGVVFTEAVILACIGYIPGYLIATGLYSLAAGATSLPLAMTVSRAVIVYILTVVMCTVSGSVAVRKLAAADPADIF